MNLGKDFQSIDFWINYERVPEAEFVEFVRLHRWTQVRTGYWYCNVADMQLEIVQTKKGLAALAWINRILN